MKIILDFGISADGFIAKSDGDSDWVAVSTAPAFEARAKEMGCIVVGRRTYEQYRGEIYPMEGAINVVLSHTAQDEDDVRSAASPEEAVVIAEQYGCRGILIAGGGETAGAFLEADLINELFFLDRASAPAAPGYKTVR